MALAAWITAVVLAQTAAEPEADGAKPAEPLVVRDWLVIAPLDQRGRRPFNPSAVLARHLLDRDAPPPKAGETLVGELGQPQTWTAQQAGADGQLGGRIATAYAAVEWPREEVVMAQLSSAATLWVNGTPQIGDVYGDGIGGLPVAMKKGTNHLFVSSPRGGFRLALSPPSAPLIVNPFDATVPDLVAQRRWGDSRGAHDVAIVIVNATDAPLQEVVIESGSEEPDGLFQRNTTVERAGVAPRGVLKVVFPLLWNDDHAALAQPGRVTLPVTVRAGGQTATTELAIDVKEPLALRRETYESGVDGSVQAYAVLPPSDGEADAIVLTLHGAGVDCMGQAASYSAKPDFWIVAPTNRRRFGFDWQDWGRLDAYQVAGRMISQLRDASATEDPERIQHELRRRVYLTGHSMGGHGTWHLAANDPGMFAAIAPSAGWSSFDSYGGGRPKGALADLWQAADGASRTLSLVDNLKQLPTYVLHGSADDNVPASEAKLMVDALTAAGAPPQVHLQEGAGHWWDGDASPGADCVDWPPLFDLFRKSVRPERVDRVSFVSNDPSTLARCDWLHVQQLERYGEPFRVDATWDHESRQGKVTTQNVARLDLSTPDRGAKATWTIDGATPVTTPPQHHDREQWFERVDGAWRAIDRIHPRNPAECWKTPRKTDDGLVSHVIGPFKRAFDRSFVLVYGTRGTPAETRELLDRARYDATHWWYRANGRALLVSDTYWLERCTARALLATNYPPLVHRIGMNVLLYGNRDTNAAWAELVPEDAPFDAARGKLRLGEQTFEGDSLGACVVLPRRDIPGLVGLFADSGPRGSRLGFSLAPFTSGVGYPDYALFSADVLTKGDGGVLAAGWFDAAWRIQAPR